MATQLTIVPPRDADLRAAVIRWCDNGASLTRCLARRLRRGRDISDMRVTALAQARANISVMETFIELLEQDDRQVHTQEAPRLATAGRAPGGSNRPSIRGLARIEAGGCARC